MRIYGLNFKEINYIRGNNKKFHTDLFLFLYNFSDDFKCTIVVKKKLVKQAVNRNRARRRIRSIMQNYTNCGVRIMLIAKVNLDDVHYEDIKSNILIFFQYLLSKK